MKQLFKNEVLINASKNEVQLFLLNVTNLMKWNWAIGSITAVGDNKYIIQRDVDALNKREIVEITKTDNQIICQSTTGTLEYRLVFELLEESGRTKVIETLYPTNNLRMPLSLVAPIAKNAFNQNLHALKDLLEIAK